MTMQFTFDGDNLTAGVTVVAPIRTYYDAALNDSDKSFTVPAGEMWKLCQAFVSLVTTATVGNRQMRMTITDASGNAFGQISAGAVQAASLTRTYAFMQFVNRETAFVDTVLQVPMPADLYLRAGSVIRFYDSAAIAAAADDMTVSFAVQVFKGC